MSFTLSNGNKDFKRNISKQCLLPTITYLQQNNRGCNLEICIFLKYGATVPTSAYRSFSEFLKVFSNFRYVFALCKAMKYTVEADTGRIRSPRVYFQNTKAATYTGLLSLPSSKYICDTLQLGVVVGFPFTYVSRVYYLHAFLTLCYLNTSCCHVLS